MNELINPNDKYYTELPQTRAEVLMLLDERMKSKSRWCSRQEIHKQLAFKVGNTYVKLCKECLIVELLNTGRLIPIEEQEDIEVAEIG